MHELSIALSLLDVVAEEARRHGDVRVLAVHLELGPLAGIVKETLVSAFELAREGSAFVDTQLIIEETPLLGQCPSCQTVRPLVSVQELCCIECGTSTPEVTSGRQLNVIAMEIQ